MPIHDWSRVAAGIFHHFHQAWIGEISRTLNDGLLPRGFYALSEQHAGRVEPDIVTLHTQTEMGNPRSFTAADFVGATTVLENPPEVDIFVQAEEAFYLRKQNTVVIHQSSNDRVIAIVEIVSRSNKSSDYTLEKFVDKVGDALHQGVHAVVLDLHPPGTWDPQGIHDAIWKAATGKHCPPPDGKELTLAAYSASPELAAYVQPSAVGDVLKTLPLFLDFDHYVRLPCEETYNRAFAAVPERWREVLTAD